MSKLNIAIVGCGRWGKNLARNFKNLGVLSAVSDHFDPAAQALSEQYNVPALSFGDILKSDIPAIVLAVQVRYHLPLAEEALLAGKHLFIEKPITMTAHDAQSLNTLAEKRGCILMVGHLMQYHPAFIKMKSLIEDGIIGKMQAIMASRKNFDRFREKEDVLISFMPHDISMILSLAKKMPRSVFASAAFHLTNDSEDTTSSSLLFESGLYANILAARFNPYKEQRFTVIGDKGMLVFSDTEEWSQKLKHYTYSINHEAGFPKPENLVERLVKVKPAEPLALECEHFIKCVKRNISPRTDGTEALAVMKILDAARSSIKSGSKIILS